MPELIRKSQAADLLGVSAPRVSQLLRAGHLSEVAGTGMLSRVEVENFAQSRDGLNPQKPQPQASDLPGKRLRAPRQNDLVSADPEGPLPPIAISRQRLEALRAEIAQHDLDSRNSKLIPRDEVARAAFQEGRRIRQALEGLPHRIGNGMASALGLDELQAAFIVQEVMSDEIHQLLSSLASCSDFS